MPLKFSAACASKAQAQSEEISRDFDELISKISTQGSQQRILEEFKSRFAAAAGYTTSWSSDVGWAAT